MSPGTGITGRHEYDYNTRMIYCECDKVSQLYWHVLEFEIEDFFFGEPGVAELAPSAAIGLQEVARQEGFVAFGAGFPGDAAVARDWVHWLGELGFMGFAIVPSRAASGRAESAVCRVGADQLPALFAVEEAGGLKVRGSSGDPAQAGHCRLLA